MVKVKFTVALFLLTLSLWWSTTAFAQGTAFTYQGKLVDSGNLANAAYDMQFKLFDAATNGNQIGSTLTFDGTGTNPPAVSVTNGIFAVTLDFGTCSPPAPCFDGSPRFLEIAVKPHGSGSYTTLTPRQPITATPYAMKTTNLTFNGAFDNGTTIFTASNSFAGDGAGLNTTPDPSPTSSVGKFNAFFGAGAGRANTTGGSNAFFGAQVGQSNTSGGGNAFFGRLAGRDNVAGSGNAFFGAQAGQSNTTGSNNAFFGTLAGAVNSSGIDNAFFGTFAGVSNTSGDGNTFIGRSADFNIVGASGNNNTLLGTSTVVNSGVSNGTAIGYRASLTQSNSLILGGITGTNGGTSVNVGIGTTAPTERLHVNGNGLFTGNLTVNGTLTATLPADSANYIQNGTSQQGGNFNISGNGTAGGTLSAAFVNATNYYSLAGLRVFTVNGEYSGSLGTFTASNTFTGEGAGLNTTPSFTLNDALGKFNAFFGAGAGQANTDGFVNAFFGAQAGQANTFGDSNAFFGALAGQANTTGDQNAFFGKSAGQQNNTGSSNAFFGETAGQQNTTGDSNAFFGAFAGNRNISGVNNTFIGTDTNFNSSNPTGNNNTLLGYFARVNSGVSNSTAIGGRVLVTQSNSLILGSINGVNNCTPANNCDTVKVGIGTTAPAALLDVQRDGDSATIPEVARFTTYGFDNEILSRATGGSRAAPAATPSGRVLLLLGATGHDGTSFVANPSASINMDTTEAWTSTANGTRIRFRTTANGSNTISTRMTIDQDGQVGIGTLTPADKLHIAGDIRVGTGTSGCVKDADGTLIAGTACSSDARLKRAITPFPHLLDKLVQLQPVTFYWRADEFKERHFGVKPSFGLIAQEVEKVLPELVTEDEQGYKAVNYSKLPLLSLQAIKELKAENDQLKQENAAIKQENQSIRQQQQLLQAQFHALKQVVCKSSPTADICKQ